MRLALALAERGAGQVSPNPKVGAVIVQGDQVVGEGWHTRFGELLAQYPEWSGHATDAGQ